MPRANRNFLPGHVWHITHRCHQKHFLLKFAQDRNAWTHWLYEARKRYGLCVLNYMVTSNHVHLLVQDTGRGEIARGMQLVAGRVAQAFNQRKSRSGAFWEDRYHATAVQQDVHLARCMTYIDLNMVRAGVVQHPLEWLHCGFHEIQSSRQRYRCIDREAVRYLFGFPDEDRLRDSLRQWVEHALRLPINQRDAIWTESVAVGEQDYLEQVKHSLRLTHTRKKIRHDHSIPHLREPVGTYRG